MSIGRQLSSKGKLPIIVWRRGRWTSMAHLRDDDKRTRCGYDVILGHGVDAIVLTQITADMLISVGCGLCRGALIRDARAEMLQANPRIIDQWLSLLDRQTWQEK